MSGWRTVRTTYEEIAYYSTKSMPCAVCGRKLRRQRKFTMTENPWNKNPDGTVRTRKEIYAALRELAEAWKAEPATHAACEGDR